MRSHLRACEETSLDLVEDVLLEVVGSRCIKRTKKQVYKKEKRRPSGGRRNQVYKKEKVYVYNMYVYI